MAEEKAADNPEGGGKSKKKLLIFAVLGVLLLAGAGGAAFFFFMQGDNESADTEQAAANPVKQPAIYTKVRTLEGKPSFVATLKAQDGRKHYMRAFVEAKSRDQETVDALTLHMPLIVARLNVLFSSQSFDELQSIDGKLALQASATELVQTILQEKIGKPGVEKILFTGFVMQ